MNDGFVDDFTEVEVTCVVVYLNCERRGLKSGAYNHVPFLKAKGTIQFEIIVEIN
jgi:hypothetical protein